MIFQEPMTSLNPVFTVGDQIGETVRWHEGLSRAAARSRALTMLRDVGIPEPELRLNQFPHELSMTEPQKEGENSTQGNKAPEKKFRFPPTRPRK
jgi:ABC-type microcin C transport system duplicated ATPase subunit YejF